MAYIKKNGARKYLETGATSSPSVKIETTPFSKGLRFNIQIGMYKVSLTHVERDMIIEQWEQQAKEFGEF